MWGAGNDVVIAGLAFRIPSAEHLIGMKMHAMKHGGLHRYLKDLLDVVGIMKELHIAIGGSQFEALCSRFADAQTRDNIIDMANKHGND